MKRILRLIPALLIGSLVALAPVSLATVSGAVTLSPNTVSAASTVEQMVYCNDGLTSGYTTDPASFCAGSKGGPANVSNGQYPFKCVDGTVGHGADATTACASHRGGVVAVAVANGPCSANEVQIAVVFPGGSHCVSNDPATGGAIVAYLRVLLKYLASLVGLVVILMLVIGGIQYIVSAGDPTQIKNAKNRIINAIVALVLFLSAFAILNLVVPGGIA